MPGVDPLQRRSRSAALHNQNLSGSTQIEREDSQKRTSLVLLPRTSSNARLRHDWRPAMPVTRQVR